MKEYQVVLIALCLFTSCWQVNKGKVQHTTSSPRTDTLSYYPRLPEAPLLSIEVAYHSNPIITGKIKGWEKRLDRMYVDSLHLVIKTLLLHDIVRTSETALALYNNTHHHQGPVLLNIYESIQNEHSALIHYWDTHAIDSTISNVFYSKALKNNFNCKFGLWNLRNILSASYPIELKDTASFKAVIGIKDKKNDKTYSPLFECYYRKKPMLICTFDIEKLQETMGGCYLWDVIRNYSYSRYFRNDIKDCVRETTAEIWYDTLMPKY